MTLPGEISNSDDSSRYEIQSEQLTQYLIKELTKQQYETKRLELQIAKAENKDNECAVCMLDNKNKIAIIPCGHTQICEKCISKFVNKTCPICRNHFDNYVRLY